MVAFANLETPLVKSGTDGWQRHAARCSARTVVSRARSAAGFDAVSVANNHSLDQTAAGLAETMDARRRLHLRAARALVRRAERAAVIERGGLRVARLVAFADRGYPDPNPGGAAFVSPDGAAWRGPARGAAGADIGGAVDPLVAGLRPRAQYGAAAPLRARLGRRRAPT